ncbi:hypothetical protein M434DRAFT_399510 [Hypoxylon sp. CO27-5]|nr:hypothetical protein M434DRAFT_399510 [Hypoxylon sp. CO27-5]
MRLYLEVPLKFLLHGHETVSPSGGPFSWCPSNLLDGSPATLNDLPSQRTHEGNVLIDKYGAAVGPWQIRLVTAEDKKSLRPYALHLSPSLLVALVGICWPEERHMFSTTTGPCVDGHYVGCVYDKNTSKELYNKARSWILRAIYATGSAFNMKIPEVPGHDTEQKRFDKDKVRGYGGVGGLESSRQPIDMSLMVERARRDTSKTVTWETLTGLTGPGYYPLTGKPYA